MEIETSKLVFMRGTLTHEDPDEVSATVAALAELAFDCWCSITFSGSGKQRRFVLTGRPESVREFGTQAVARDLIEVET